MDEKIEALLNRPDASMLLGRIECPTLLICGDADAVRLEHSVELFRLLGRNREA